MVCSFQADLKAALVQELTMGKGSTNNNFFKKNPSQLYLTGTSHWIMSKSMKFILFLPKRSWLYFTSLYTAIFVVIHPDPGC